MGLISFLNSFSGIDELDYFGSRCRVEKSITVEEVVMTFMCNRDAGHEDGGLMDREWHRAESLGMKFGWMN